MSDSPIDTQVLGALIARRREQRGWTRYRLAEKASTKANYVTAVEKGSPRPGFAVVAQIAYALGLSLDRLAHEAGLGIGDPDRWEIPPEVALERTTDLPESSIKEVVHMVRLMQLEQELSAGAQSE